MIEVIVPQYGHRCYLPDLIQSMLHQDLNGWCLKIYNDEPGRFFYYSKDSQIQIYHGDKNEGQSFRFNQGIVEAKSEWVAFMGADDMAMNWKISSLDDHTKDADVIYTDAIQLMQNDERYYIKSMDFDPAAIMLNNFIVASTVAVRRKFVIEKDIPFQSDLRYGEDWYFYNELAIAGARFKYLPWPTVYYRDYTSNIKVRYGVEWIEQKKQLWHKIQELYK